MIKIKHLHRKWMVNWWNVANVWARLNRMRCFSSLSSFWNKTSTLNGKLWRLEKHVNYITFHYESGNQRLELCFFQAAKNKLEQNNSLCSQLDEFNGRLSNFMLSVRNEKWNIRSIDQKTSSLAAFQPIYVAHYWIFREEADTYKT